MITERDGMRERERENNMYDFKIHNKVHPHSGQHPSYHGSRQPPLGPGLHAQGHEKAC